MKKCFPIVLLAVIICTSCSTSYNPQSVEYADYRVKQQAVTDSSILKLLFPYRQRLSSVMNEVIATVAEPLTKKQPEGTLGNIMADALLQRASATFGQHVDVALINYGGIRLNELPAGALTRGKVFELSPFDNTIVLLTIKGDVLKKFLDLVAARGGWPVAGMTMQIADKKATAITIAGRPLNENANYILALPDYIANGGDDATMLKGLPRQDKGIVYRDELLAYFTQFQKEGKSISSSIEGRVTNN